MKNTLFAEVQNAVDTGIPCTILIYHPSLVCTRKYRRNLAARRTLLLRSLLNVSSFWEKMRHFRGRKQKCLPEACASTTTPGEGNLYFMNSPPLFDSTIDTKNTEEIKLGVTGEALWIRNSSTAELVGLQSEATQDLRDQLDCSFHFSRLRYYNNVKSSSQFINTRGISTGERRQAAAAGVAHHFQDESALRETVSGLVKRVYEGTTIDSYSYVDILQRCSKQINLELVQQLHDCIKKSGLEQNPYVASSLLKSYIGCGRLLDAQELFNKSLNKDIVMWTIMIRGYVAHDQPEGAIEVYKQLRNDGGQPNAITYVTVLKACASRRALNWGKDIHAHIILAGLQADVPVCNALVHMYAKCGSVDDARMVFDRMVVRDVISWNAIIGGLAQHGHVHEAISLFLQMQGEGLTPNSVTYLCILSARADRKDLTWVKEVHSHATKSGFAQDVCVNNALIHIYANCGSMDDAKLVFDSVRNRNIISWNAMIGGLAQNGRWQEALSYFHHMQREGFVPNSATYLSILTADACEDALAWVKEVHDHARRSGLNVDLRVDNALVHMYAKSGSIEDARTVFDLMKRRNIVSWNTMIGGLAQHGLGHEAFFRFLQMQREGFIPDSTTYVSILNPSSSIGALEWVVEVHNQAIKAGLDVDLRVGNALVHMYGKIGNIAVAREVFDRMIDRNVISWTLMIGGLAEHGQGREAVQLFEEMKSTFVKPDGPLFLSVLSACSHAGLVDEGRFQLLSMTGDYGIEPGSEHFTCMVDILGRAGHLEEAKLVILDMPMKPRKATWGALLGACRVYNNVSLAEFAAEGCSDFEPMDPSPYVLLSNIYAAVGRWDQVSMVRSHMNERGILKDPGRCWIEVDNKIDYFVAGDTSHPESNEIYATLKNLYKNLKAEGYIPDTRLVLRNIEEEDKEYALSSHSEKLAIAYGLMHVPSGKPIRIFKNLRMCTDCHTATKCISKVTGREIVARDAKRFHHFKDGVCSCGDFW